jgi:hypothetical protein
MKPDWVHVQLPRDVHRAVKIEAAKRGAKVQDLVTEFVKKGLGRQS